MADTELRVNSLRIRFERGVPEPTHADIFKFMKLKMMLNSEQLLSMYKDKAETSVIIKFKNQEDMNKTLRDLPDTMEFDYNQNDTTIVKISPANVFVRYVRLFNLPPEVEDKDISTALSKFGKVTRMVREKYGEDTGFPIWTSVRGVYVELKDGIEIPPTIHIKSLRARVFYEGLTNKCFVCGSKEHLKAECPQMKSVNERLKNSQQPSYSSTVKGDARWIVQRAESGKEQVAEMVNLGSVPPTRDRIPTVSNTMVNTVETKGANESEAHVLAMDSSTIRGVNTDVIGEETAVQPTKTQSMTSNDLVTVTNRKGRKHTKDTKETDSDNSTGEVEQPTNNVVTVPKSDRISDVTDRCTRSKAKQIKLGESSTLKVNNTSSNSQTMDFIDDNSTQ